MPRTLLILRFEPALLSSWDTVLPILIDSRPFRLHLSCPFLREAFMELPPLKLAVLVRFHSMLYFYFVSDVIVCITLGCPSMLDPHGGRDHLCSICYSIPHRVADIFKYLAKIC